LSKDGATLPSIPTGAAFDSIDRLLERGEHRAAWAQLSRLILAQPTSANCHAVSAAAARLDATRADLISARVAVLANFTAEPVAPILRARALPSRLLLDTWVAGYDVWSQEILDPGSRLRTAAPDVVILALELETLAPALASDFLEHAHAHIMAQIQETAGRVQDAIRALRSWSKAKVLVHAFPLPTRRALGMYDPVAPHGQTAAIRALNDRLRDMARAIDNCFVVDIDRLVMQLGEERWRDRRMALLARMPLTPLALHALAEEYLRYLRAFSGAVRKVLVVDLDNTLWGGILGEDGIDGIQLGDTYPGSAYVDLQKAMLALHRRGVVLAINSKNNAADVAEVLERHPSMVLKPEHFAAMRVNWQDKLTNMVELADELGLGIDSFVFIDDSDAECERLRQALPEVLTLQLGGEPAARVQTLGGLGVFDTLSHSDEDRERGTFYRREVQRTQLRKSLQTIEEFYASLEMQLFVEPIDDRNVARAADLTQRTNQFNLTTRRFTRDELAALTMSEETEVYGFRLVDRFGDSGMIAVAMLRAAHDKMTVENLLMSCRVLKRTVEDAVLAFVVERAASRAAPVIEGLYRPSKKNGLVADLYRQHGFTPARQLGDTQVFVRSTEPPLPYPSWIHVIQPAATRHD
jgi:FkbH-like protein